MRRVLGMGLGHRDGSLGQGDKSPPVRRALSSRLKLRHLRKGLRGSEGGTICNNVILQEIALYDKGCRWGVGVGEQRRVPGGTGKQGGKDRGGGVSGASCDLSDRSSLVYYIVSSSTKRDLYKHTVVVCYLVPALATLLPKYPRPFEDPHFINSNAGATVAWLADLGTSLCTKLAIASLLEHALSIEMNLGTVTLREHTRNVCFNYMILTSQKVCYATECYNYHETEFLVESPAFKSGTRAEQRAATSSEEKGLQELYYGIPHISCHIPSSTSARLAYLLL
ncbi:hypothetical protein Tco_0722694 [Tanacetum coccineum]